MEKTNLENLNRLAKLFGTDRLISPEDIQEIRSILIGVLANNKKEVESLTEETKQAINSVLDKVLTEHDTYLEKTKQIAQEAKSETTEAINSTLKSLEEVKALCKEVMECKPENGEDADEEYVIQEVLAKIKLPEYKEVVLDDGTEIVAKINELPVNEDNQIDAKHIKNLPEFKNGRWSGITKGAVIKLIQEMGGAGVTLKVNGTSNVDQGTLDLIAGSGITITDNGDGTVTFTATGGSGSPGGSTTQLQYNNAGAFGGIAGATTDGTATTYTTGNLKVADVKASGSAGIQTLSNNGTVIALQGAGGGANNTFYGSIKGDYLTASEIVISDGSKNIVSAPVATYPSLTELTYVKGVTSAIQTQLGNKQPLDTDLTTIAALTPSTGEILTWSGTEWIAATPTATVGSANSFFPEITASLADNLTLTVTPSTYPETVNTKTVLIATSPVLFERFVSGPLGRTSIPAGKWVFNTYGGTDSNTGTNEIKFRVNKRVAQTGMTGTFTGSGATRTFTVTGGTPFVAGDANASRMLASLIETPTQTAWISSFTSSSVVTVTLTDPSFVNVSNVELSAIYHYLFDDTTGDITDSPAAVYTTTTTQPAFTGLNLTDRLVVAYFGSSDNNTGTDTMSLYYGGTQHFTNFSSPISTLHNELAGLNVGDYKHLTDAEYTGTGTGNFVRATSPTLVTPILGTPTSGTLTNATGLPISGLTPSTSTAIGVGTIELGHASDTTISRVSAGVIAVEGVVIPSISSTNTLTNKAITKRVVTTTDDATAVIDVAVTDVYELTAMANATAFSFTGTPTDGQTFVIRYKDNGTSRALTWTGITAIGVTLPTASTISKWGYVGIMYNAAASAYHATAVATEA